MKGEVGLTALDDWLLILLIATSASWVAYDHKKRKQKFIRAALWVAVTVWLPIIGLLLYVFIGRKLNDKKDDM